MHRRVRRAWLGLYCQVIPISHEFRRSLPKGALAGAKSAVHVQQIEMGGPGQKGGIEVNTCVLSCALLCLIPSLPTCFHLTQALHVWYVYAGQ